jgi:UDP-N-acetyl-D-mannosaminuronic acid dehydrogenase
MGYIGLPTAATLAGRGLEVVGVDVNESVLEKLQKGELHIQEPGLGDLVGGAIRSGRLTFNRTPVEADAFIIAVPTPFKEQERGQVNNQEYKIADMTAVRSAAESIIPVLQKGNLVVLESTSPPRTTVDLVQPILERSGLKAGLDFHLVYTPERVLPGRILVELVENARVIGGITPQAAEAGKELYALFVSGELHVTDATTAEMVKLMENTYRDINIAIAIEFSRLAERFGVDVWEAIRLANLHPRVKILRPGPGVGGHCISVDPWFFVEAAPDLANLIHAARLVNDHQPHHVLTIIRQAVGTLKTKRIAALGLAFKEDVDDLRESPAVELSRLMAQEGAEVRAFEPNKPDAKFDGFETFPSLKETLAKADAIVLLVGHKEFIQLKAEDVKALTPARLVVDLRGALVKKDWEAAGFRVVIMGNGRA